MWCFKYSNQAEQGQSTNIALRDELKNKYPDFCNILGRGERLRGPWVQIVLKVKSNFFFLEGWRFGRGLRNLKYKFQILVTFIYKGIIATTIANLEHWESKQLLSKCYDTLQV